MNKGLLIWNVVLTVLMISVVFVGCTSMDPQFAYLQSKVERNSTIVEQLADAVNENTQRIQNQELQNKALQMSVEASLKQTTTSLQEYVQEYVSSQLAR